MAVTSSICSLGDTATTIQKPNVHTAQQVSRMAGHYTRHSLRGPDSSSSALCGLCGRLHAQHRSHVPGHTAGKPSNKELPQASQWLRSGHGQPGGTHWRRHHEGLEACLGAKPHVRQRAKPGCGLRLPGCRPARASETASAAAESGPAPDCISTTLGRQL